MRKRLVAISISGLLAVAANAQTLVAVDDHLSLHNGGQLINGVEALFLNDVLPADSVQIVIVTEPQHGSLQRLDGHTFIYQAEAGYVGGDSFQYRIQTLPVQHLAFEPSQSMLEFDVSVKTTLGTDDDKEDLNIVGEVELDLGVVPTAIDSIRILDLNIRNESAFGLRFDYGVIVTVGTLRINADAEAVQLFIAEAGEKTPTSGILRVFTQSFNLIGVNVDTMLDGSGLLSGQVSSDPQSLTTETRIDLTGAVIVQGGDILLLLTIDSDYSFDLSGSEVELSISGSLQASGSFVAREESGVATVTIDVQQVTSDESGRAIPDQLSLSIYPNPARNSVRIDFELPRPSSGHILVHDLLGRVVSEKRIPNRGSGRQSIFLDTNYLAPGAYFVTLVLGDVRISRPLFRI